MSQEIKFGPWPLGVDNVHLPNAVPTDQYGYPQALTDALNVDIDPTGLPATRGGQSLMISMAGCHSVCTLSVGTFFVAQGNVYRLVSGWQAQQVAVLNSDDPTSFDDFQGQVIASNRTSLMVITPGGYWPLAVPDATGFFASAVASGGLTCGMYGVSYAFVRNGVEGSLATIQTLYVPESGGITITVPAVAGADSVYLFRTEAGGMVLQQCGIVAPGSTTTITSGDLGQEPIGQYMRGMPNGDFVNAWRGLTLIAVGRNLYFSEPYAPHLNSRRFGFVQFPRKINFVRGVQEGVFVGTKEDVFFLPGEKPRDWKVVSTGGQPAASRGAILVDGSDLDDAYKLTGQNVAVWLSTSGFVLGTADGSIIEPQATRFKNALPQQASIAYSQRRLTAILT